MDFQESELYRSVYYRYFSRAPKHIADQFTASKKLSRTQALVSTAVDTKEEENLEVALAKKKDLKQMTDKYEPNEVEKYWYRFWKGKKYFHADLEKAKAVPHSKRYTMVIPPPNVTSYLHIGHALFVAIEDSLTRWHRMRGDVTCWLPGLDHAGIGTQSVVEKTLLKKGLNKNQLGREKFLDEVWAWKEKHGNLILNQFEKLGASVDWDRFSFTMDPKLNRGVSEAFIRLHERDLIYRSYRLVNWSCKLQTALSDIEVEFQEINEPTKIKFKEQNCEAEFGVLIQFAYKVKDSDREIVVATTRIETMLGDTAVAVHSSDERYKDLVGKDLIHPFIPNRKIKVITDDDLVDPTFGTGAVKITPGHDHKDCKSGLKNKLEFINIFNNDGTINDNGGQYKNLFRYECRNKIIDDLQKLGLLRGKEKNPMRLGFCSRSGDVIEPLLRPQWYVKCEPIQQRMREVVEKKELKIIPDMFEQEWFKWIDDLRDWCISRQLWWGHRCPAYLVTIEELGIKPDFNDEKNWVCAHSAEEALEKAAKKYGVDKSKIKLQQDEDVLDTWFSSALFPFTPFGWPDDFNKELDTFYPGHVLETGHDILFFWVAKMVMMGLYLTEKLPFTTVYLHNLVRDKDGEKMSKSKGNVIDPLDVINGATLEQLQDRLKEGNLSKEDMDYHLKRRAEDYPNGIPACGSDALRFSLLTGCIQARYMNMDVRRIISDRMFVQKIWQSFKFFTTKLTPNFTYNPASINVDTLSLADRWILGRLEWLIETMNKYFETYKFGELAQVFQAFWFDDLCDVYIEATKPAFAVKDADTTATQTVLFTVYEQGLRLLHPMMPYISEELYQKLPNWNGKSESICIAPYPTVNGWKIDQDETNYTFDLLYSIVKSTRSLGSSLNLPNTARPPVFLLQIGSETEQKRNRDIVEKNVNFIITLAKIGKLNFVEKKGDIPSGCITGVLPGVAEVHIDVKEYVDVKKEIERLEKKIEQNNGFIEGIKTKMNAPEYSKAPQKVRDDNQKKLDNYNTENAKLQESLDNYKKFL